MTATLEASAVGVLRGAAELLNIPERWTQRAAARDGDGLPVPANDPNAVSWCMIGALVCNAKDLAGGDGERYSNLMNQSTRAIRDVAGGIPSIGDFNDHNDHETCRVALVEAADLLESRYAESA